MLRDHLYDHLKQCPSWISNACLLSCAAEGLTRKARSQKIMARNLAPKLPNVTRAELAASEIASVDGACFRIHIVSPDGLNTRAVSGQAKPTYTRKQFHGGQMPLGECSVRHHGSPKKANIRLPSVGISST